MTRYLISFDDGAMTFPAAEIPEVAEAAHQVVQEAKNAGVWVFGGGVERQSARIVATEERPRTPAPALAGVGVVRGASWTAGMVW